MRSFWWVLIDGAFKKTEREREREGKDIGIQGKTGGDDSRKRQTFTSQRETSKETSPVDSLVSDLDLADLRENKFLLFKPPNLWYFFMKTQAN